RAGGLVRCACTRRGLLILAGVFACVYALVILWYVQSVPDLGLRTAFSVILKKDVNDRYLRLEEGPWRLEGEKPLRRGKPQAGDTVVQIGDRAVGTWPDLLAAPYALRDKLADADDLPAGPWKRRVTPDGEELLVWVRFERPGPEPGQATTLG